MKGAVRLPGFWRFAWLFFMQPITLHRRLRELGVDPGVSGWKLLRRTRSVSENWWLLRASQLLFLLAPGAAFVAADLLAAAGVPVDWSRVAFSVAFSVAGGVAFGVASGVTVGVASGVAGGVAFGVASGVTGGVAGGVAIGVVVVVAVGVAVGVTGGVAVGVAFGVSGGVADGVAVGVPVVVAVGVAFLRFPVYPVELIWHAAVRLYGALTGRRTLAFSPVLYHELSLLPHPFLERHLLAEADADPALTRRVLDACSTAPGQRRIGRRVEARLRAAELKRLAETRDFQAIAEVRGVWLPGIAGADPVLLSFSEAGRYLVAAQAAFNPHHRLKHLAGLDAQANAIENQLRSERNAFTAPYEESLVAIRTAGAAIRKSAETDAAGIILNPFRAGDALSGEVGPELFRGRKTAVREIEDILADTSRSASLLVLAPRRSGKTSLLKMLPSMLPDSVCVFFDLQAHPVASVGAFWSTLAEQAVFQARRDRRIELPRFPDGPPLEAAAKWLELLDRPDGRPVLLAIDEFERLQDLFPGSRQEFLQTMGLFRATIQHRRRVRLLVSGAAPFDELDRVWDDHFISVRQIRLPFLDLPTSVGLLTQPSPEFPPGTISDEAAREVYRLTAGQPFLLHIYGSLLVDRLNRERSAAATPADVQAVEERAIERAETYFRDMFRSAPEAAGDALGRLARGQPADLAPATRRWLTQRYLLTPDDRLAIPLFGVWIEHHALA